MVLAVSKCQAADVSVDGIGQSLGHRHIIELGAVDTLAAHTVGLNREGLPIGQESVDVENNHIPAGSRTMLIVSGVHPLRLSQWR